MKKNANARKLLQTIQEEENVIEHKNNIGYDKFAAADKVLSTKETITKQNKLPGVKKSIYISAGAVDTINEWKDSLLSQKIITNDSKIITVALEILSNTDKNIVFDKLLKMND